MAERQNLPAQVCRIFAAIRHQSEPDRRSLLQMWRDSLKVTGDDFELIHAVNLISKALHRLRDKVQALETLSERPRSLYTATIDGLLQVTSPSQLHTQVHQWKTNFDESKRDQLLILADMMHADAPVPQLSDVDADDLRSTLVVLREMLEGAGIRSDVKGVLIRHCSFMLWALDNSDLLGIDGLYEAVMAAILEAHRARVADTSPEGCSVFDGIIDFGRKAMKALDCADRIAQGVEAISDMTSGFPLLS